MKLNPDCIRDILITIENYPVPMDLIPQEFYKLLPQYSSTEINYCSKRLYEAGYINLVFISVPSTFIKSSNKEIQYFGDLTYLGHEFLEYVKTDTIWRKIKSKASSLGCFALPILQQIASQIIVNKL